MDALSEVFETIHFERVIYRQIELSPPWNLQFSNSKSAVLFFLTKGSFSLQMKTLDTPLHIAAGDLVLLPHGQSHSLENNLESSNVSDENQPLTPVALTQQVIKSQHSVLFTTLIYVRLDLGGLTINPILAALPEMILVRGNDKQAVPWLNTNLQLITCEINSNLLGVGTVTNHLAVILFIHAVRFYIANKENCGRCWLRALTHPHIGSGLQLMHHYPEKSWTVGSLASEVGMSRSAFATQFRELVGEPPLQYLTRWRIHKAARLLRQGDKTISEIASLVGYESETAFSHTFKRWMDQFPGSYRQTTHLLRDQWL